LAADSAKEGKDPKDASSRILDDLLKRSAIKKEEFQLGASKV
jgi:hypothetical protein